MGGHFTFLKNWLAGVFFPVADDEKLVDLEYCSRQNNLRFEGIKEHENESWEDCKNKIYDLLENKLEMDIEKQEYWEEKQE